MAHEQSKKRPGDDEHRTGEPSAKKGAPRKRATLACEECRARKRRCDGLIPCEGCFQRLTDCHYPSDAEAKKWHKSVIDTLRARLAELENDNHHAPSADRQRRPPKPRAVEESVPRKATAQPATTTTTQTRPEANLDLPLLAPSAAPDVNVPSYTNLDASTILLPTAGDEPSSTAPGDPSPSRCIQPRNFEEMMMPIAREMEKRNGPSAELSTPSATSMSMAWPEPTPTAPCSCHWLFGALHGNLPLRKDADALVELFFARHGRIYPVLHQQKFMMQYERLWDSHASTQASPKPCVGLCTQKSKGKLLPTLVNLVLALGSLFRSPSLEDNAVRAEPFYRVAEETNLVQMMDDEVNFELVQAGLLMGIYLQTTERYSKCWNLVGLTIRMAQNMGLHLEVMEARRRGLLSPDSSQFEAEMRARLWYGCVILDTDIALSFSQPLMITTSTNWMTPLRILSDKEGASPAQDGSNLGPRESSSFHEYHYHMLELYRILRQIIQREPASTSSIIDMDVTIKDLLSLDSRIERWSNRLPSYLRHDPDGDRASQTSPAGRTFEISDGLDDFALSERVHTRYLYVRQLILRPALELLFGKQAHDESSSAVKSLEAKICESTLAEIASQCVQSALDLMEFLSIRIEKKELTCWWYNTSFLYATGTTLLMAQSCILKESRFDQQSLAKGWNLCLQSLSHYQQLSSIAKTSSDVLRDCYQRLLEQRESVRVHQTRGENDLGATTSIPPGFWDTQLSTVDWRPPNYAQAQQMERRMIYQHSNTIPSDPNFFDPNCPNEDLSTIIPEDDSMEFFQLPYLPAISQFEAFRTADTTSAFRLY